MESITPMTLLWFVFPIIVLFACQFIVRVFSLTARYHLKTPDLSIPFLLIGLHQLSRAVVQHSILPYFVLTLCLLGVGVVLFQVHEYEEINFARFFKMYWRLAFLMTLVLYICLIVAVIFSHF